MPVAIPGAALAMGALLAFLILWGVQHFGQAMASFIPKSLPIVGTVLHNTFLVIATIGQAACQWLMADVIRPVINLIIGPVLSFIDWLVGVARLASSTAGTIAWLVANALPEVLRLAKAYALRIATAVKTQLVGMVGAVESLVYKLVAAANATALALYGKALDYAADLYTKADTLARALYDKSLAYTVTVSEALRTYSWSLVHNLEGSLTDQINALRATVTAGGLATTKLINDQFAQAVKIATSTALIDTTKLIHLVDVDVAAVMAVEWPLIIDEVTALDAVIGTDLPAIGAAVRSVPRAVPTDQVAAIAAVGALAVPLIRYMRQCGVPNCRNLSKYGRDLQNLLNAVAVGGLMAFFAEMVTDPEGAARQVSDVLGPIAGAAGREAADLLGAA